MAESIRVALVRDPIAGQTEEGCAFCQRRDTPRHYYYVPSDQTLTLPICAQCAGALWAAAVAL